MSGGQSLVDSIGCRMATSADLAVNDRLVANVVRSKCFGILQFPALVDESDDFVPG